MRTTLCPMTLCRMTLCPMTLSLMIGLVVCQTAPQPLVYSQELGRSPRDAETKAERRAIPTYFVRVAEARTQEEPPAEASKSELLAWLEKARKENKIEIQEMVRISVVDGFDATAQFGKRVPIVTGTNVTPQGTTRSYTSVDFGTILRVRAQEAGDQVRLQINYESSRVDGDLPEDRPAKIDRTQFNSSILTKPGDPVLLFTDSANGKGRFLVLTLEK